LATAEVKKNLEIEQCQPRQTNQGCTRLNYFDYYPKLLYTNFNTGESMSKNRFVLLLIAIGILGGLIFITESVWECTEELSSLCSYQTPGLHMIAIVGALSFIIFLIMNPKNTFKPAWQITKQGKSAFHSSIFLKDRICAHITEILLILLAILLWVLDNYFSLL